MTARATKKVEEILASHFPDHVPEAVDAAIRERFPVRLARARMRPAASAVAAPDAGLQKARA